MDIMEFLDKASMSKKKFAEKCGINITTMWAIATKKVTPTLKNALIIRKFTKNLVNLEDLLPKEDLEEIEKIKEFFS